MGRPEGIWSADFGAAIALLCSSEHEWNVVVGAPFSPVYGGLYAYSVLSQARTWSVEAEANLSHGSGERLTLEARSVQAVARLHFDLACPESLEELLPGQNFDAVLVALRVRDLRDEDAAAARMFLQPRAQAATVV